MNFSEQLIYNLGMGDQYEEAREFELSNPAVRLVAFYLPQFHPIPENDKWWGKGFTEWTNVTKAIPRFEGHYQPHLPGQLGFYDLRLPDSLRSQANLARQFGLYGFCFHYYWFSGRKLLDTTLNILLSNPDIDVRFCINWANESWSRRWDGSEQDILIEQRHSEDDDHAFAAALEPIVRDPRYIRIGGRPLILFYRPRVLPDASATVRRWREQFKSLRLEEPYVAMVQAHGEQDPRAFGMDAAVGFPPHGSWHLSSTNEGSAKQLVNGFRGRLLSYDRMAQFGEDVEFMDYTFFPGVCPSWDNEARSPNRGVCFVGSTPRKYGDWLDKVCRKILRRKNEDERLVFINAWNEWAEGTHLEPDRHFGYAYLNETARVLTGLSVERPVSDAIGERSQRSTAKQPLRKFARKAATALERFAVLLRSI